MSDFKAEVVKVEIEEHPNADALELAVIGGYRAVVKKGQFRSGDLAVYIPEQAVLPKWLVKQLGLEGRLAGKNSDRVKAVKLRGALSQGLVFPVDIPVNPITFEIVPCVRLVTDDGIVTHNVEEGQDVTDLFGIVKWEPPIPTSMSGQVWNASGKTLKFDIQNWKNHPDVLVDGEPVVFTEKAHGTFCAMGIYDGTYVVNSKGLGAKGLAFKLNPQNAGNLYVRMFNTMGQAFVDTLTHILDTDSVFVLGEIFGKGVQDLHYGTMQPTFRVFDIFIGNPNMVDGENGRYLTPDEVRNTLSEFETRLHDSDMGDGAPIDYDGFVPEYMPVLYEGPFSVEVMNHYTDGKETLSGNAMHVREGIVIRTANERFDDELGRVILKSVSGDYLTRKGGTEYN